MSFVIFYLLNVFVFVFSDENIRSLTAEVNFQNPLEIYSNAYELYEKELKHLRSLIVKFCNSPKPSGFPHSHKV